MTSVVSIPDCSADQLVREGSFHLCPSGELEVFVEADTVTIRLGDNLAFPLHPSAPLYSHSQYPLWYFLRGPMVDTYVRIALPVSSAEHGSDAWKLRGVFEEALNQANLLKTGIESSGARYQDETKEDVAWIVEWIETQAEEHPDTSEAPTFSESMQSLAASASSSSAAAASYAASAAQTFAQSTYSAFSGIWGQATGQPKSPDTAEKLHGALSEAGYTQEVESGKPLPEAPSPHPFDLKPIVDGAKGGAATVASAVGPVVEAAKGLARSLSKRARASVDRGKAKQVPVGSTEEVVEPEAPGEGSGSSAS